MKYSVIVSSLALVATLSPVWGTWDDQPLLNRPDFDSTKQVSCDYDDFRTRCYTCTALSSFQKQSCYCNNLNGSQDSLRKSDPNFSWISQLKTTIFSKCYTLYQCKCGKGCSGSGGDPHFRTLDGHLYSYHGGCDLIMARSPNYGSGVGLDMHARTKIVEDWSLISNIAVRLGDDIFELTRFGEHYLNGVPNLPLPITLAGKYIVSKHDDVIEPFDQNDGKEISQVMYEIELENDERILLSVFKEMISVSVEGRLEGTHGMLGTYGVDGLVGRDGVTIHTDVNQMGADWQVNPATEPKLFHEVGDVQYPEQCELPVKTGRRLRKHSAEFRRRAKEACFLAAHDLFDKCYNDVLLTGDLNIVHGYSF